MSNAYLTAVFNHTPELSPSQFAVLLALADQASDDTRLVFVKVETLELRAHLARRTVFKVIAELEERGWLRIERRTARASIYHLRFDHLGTRLTEREWETQGCGCEACRKLSTGGASRAPQGRKKGASRASQGASRAPQGASRAPITQSYPGPIHKSSDRARIEEKDGGPAPPHIREHLAALSASMRAAHGTETETE